MQCICPVKDCGAVIHVSPSNDPVVTRLCHKCDSILNIRMANGRASSIEIEFSLAISFVSLPATSSLAHTCAHSTCLAVSVILVSPSILQRLRFCSANRPFGTGDKETPVRGGGESIYSRSKLNGRPHRYRTPRGGIGGSGRETFCVSGWSVITSFITL